MSAVRRASRYLLRSARRRQRGFAGDLQGGDEGFGDSDGGGRVCACGNEGAGEKAGGRGVVENNALARGGGAGGGGGPGGGERGLRGIGWTKEKWKQKRGRGRRFMEMIGGG